MQPAVESRRTEAMRSSPERTLLVFIHGVNFFDPKDVAAAMSSSRLAPLLAAKPILHVFNWDALVGFPFHHDNVNPKYVAQVGAGILNSAHLGFASAQCAGALGEKRQSFVELTAYVLQCLALVLPYVVLVAVGFRLSIVPITAALVAAVTGLLITVICAKGGAVWGWAGFRRMLLLYFWPWLHLLLLPVAVPLRLALQLALVTVAWLLVMLGMALIAHPYTIEGAEPPHTLFGSSIPYDPVSGFLFALLVTPLSWLLLKTVASILFRFLAPVAKVMSDIVRYIGLPGYRRRIVSTLRSEIESLKPSGAHLVFVTHSLGSVIAAECLLQLAHEVDGPSRVTLISMGSPLKRCFHRFFGAHFPSPTALAVGFAARWKRFQWCNVYRPWDFVGSGLGLPSSVGGLDVNTRQWGRVGPNSHTGYWADPVANGDSVVNRLRVGRNVRNTPDYSDFCGTYYVTPPDDSLWHQVRTGPLFESNTWYFDEQEVRIPKEQRGSPISYVELRCDSTIAPGTSCPGQRETILFGMSLWNRFRVANSSGDAMPLTLQTGNSAPYGGYYDGTTLVGDDRTISALGCLLTSICMVHGFYGIDVTPDSLNRYLQQRHYGYGTAKAALATITSIGANDTVYFDWHGSFDSHGPKFLIEHGQFNPVATIRIVGSLNKTAKTGRGVIDGGPYHGRTVAVGDKGRVYDRVDTRAAGLGYAITRGHRWGVYSLYDGATPLPRQAEAHMAVDIPVLLHTRLDSANNGRHWVVGIGREPAFTSPTTAKGTYAVRDPGWGASRLSDSPHVNKFSEARACSLLEVPGNPAQYPPDADPDTTGLEILLSGPATFEVRDQLGRTVSYDATSNMYISHIPSADAWRSFSVDDIDDTNDTSDLAEAAVDVVRIPLALDGAYLVTVAGKDAGDYQLSASAIGVPGTAASSDWFGTVSAGSTATYRVIYSRGAGTVTVATTAVDESNAARVMFGLEDISPNPTPGGTRIAFALRRSDAVDLTVFDLSGRRVRRLASGIMTAGPHTVSWDGRDENGQQARAGVYFVRLASGNDRSAKRMVVLP